jgi:predicted nucleic acid-binding protein
VSGERVAYLDSSAYVKLVLEEREEAALARSLEEWPARVSSVLLVVEAVRAASRYGEEFAQRARAGIDNVSLLPIDVALLDVAGGLRPASLRSLDAVHLASAMKLGSGLGAMYCYDRRLAEAARAAGIDVRAPA